MHEDHAKINILVAFKNKKLPQVSFIKMTEWLWWLGSAGCEFSVLFTILYFVCRLVSPPLCFSVGLPLSVPTLLSPSHCCCQLIERPWLPSHHHLLPLHTPASHLQSRPVFLPRLNRPSPLDRCSRRPDETLSKHSLKSSLFSYLLPNAHLPYVSLSSVSISDRHLQSAGFTPQTPSLRHSASACPRLLCSPVPVSFPQLLLPRAPEYPPLSVLTFQFLYPPLSSFPIPAICLSTPLFP